MTRQPIDARSDETACGLGPKDESGGARSAGAKHKSDILSEIERLLV